MPLGYATGGSTPRLSEPPVPVDVLPVFLIVAAMVILFPLLSREKLDHSPNDASRWNTVYFLVEHGTYAYHTDWDLPWNGGRGKTLDEIDPDQLDRMIKVGDLYFAAPWDFWGIAPFWSIDMVRIGDDYYSSKPPLLSTCVAGVVWLIYRVTDLLPGVEQWTFVNRPWAVMRTTVIIVQVIPFLIAVWLIGRLVREQSSLPWVRNFCIASAALGTYLTPYVLTLNNHVVGACALVFSLYALIRIWYHDQKGWHWFVVGGFFAGLLVTVELPAASAAVCIGLLLLIASPGRALTAGLLAAAVPVAALLITNHIATGSIIPVQARFAEAGGPYDYPGSYWYPNAFWDGPSGLDALREPRAVYLTHLVVGHHGFFSLTPIFLISLIGMVAHWLRRDDRAWSMLSVMVLLVTAVVVTFYAFFTKETQNYGGTCQGPRWLFWLIPLWLLMLPAGVRLLAPSRPGRVVCCLLLAVSLVSVFWALPQVADTAQRPWSDSWLHLLFRHWGWIHY